MLPTPETGLVLQLAASHMALASIAAMTTFHDFEMTSITGDQVSFSSYEGQTCLIVNVASN